MDNKELIKRIKELEYNLRKQNYHYNKLKKWGSGYVWDKLIEKWVNDLKKIKFSSEKDVEIRFVSQLVFFLGIPVSNIQIERTITIQAGRGSHNVRPDWVIQDDKQEYPLMVIEVKGPNIKLGIEQKKQAASYANELRSTFYMLTNGHQIRLFNREKYEDKLIFDCKVENLKEKWREFFNIIFPSSNSENSIPTTSESPFILKKKEQVDKLLIPNNSFPPPKRPMDRIIVHRNEVTRVDNTYKSHDPVLTNNSSNMEFENKYFEENLNPAKNHESEINKNILNNSNKNNKNSKFYIFGIILLISSILTFVTIISSLNTLNEIYQKDGKGDVILHIISVFISFIIISYGFRWIYLFFHWIFKKALIKTN